MYNCFLCSRTFSRRDNMKRHMRLLHRTCELCLNEIGNGINHKCNMELKNREMDEGSQDTEMQNDSGDESAGYESDEEAAKESGGESEEDIMSKSSSDTDDEVDVFSKDDQDLESDATITSSEEEEEEDREYNPMEDSNCHTRGDMDEESYIEDVKPLNWPNHTYFLVSRWKKYGEGDFKLIQHHSWLEGFEGLSNSRILRRVRHASESEVEAFCEIALNILSGNAYVRMVDKTFILKNIGLIRGLANDRISPERKKKHVVDRGADFIRRFVDIINPLFQTLRSM